MARRTNVENYKNNIAIQENLTPDRVRIQDATNKEVFGSRTATKGQSDPTPLAETFGLPPDNLLSVSNRKMLDSMPICHFQPSIADFSRGLDLFHLKSAWEVNTAGPGALGYKDLLKQHGFQTGNTAGQGIKVAYLADSFPTDTFTNEYGENFLQKFTDVASEGAATLAQLSGKTSGIEGLQTLLTPLADMLPKVGDIDLAAAAKSGGAALKKAGTSALSSLNISGAANMIDRLAAGARIDFPQIWKSSGFQPSYTMTVRLYNPNPRSIESTRRYIVGPIVAIMLLAVPTTTDGASYTWPFLHKIVSPGIFELDPGFIANITVIKGGDQQQISLQQRLGIVDVRIDVGSLYSSMVAGGTKIQQKTRPSVRKYVDAMLNPSPRRHEVFDRQGIYNLDSKTRINQVKAREARFRELDKTIDAKIAQDKVESPTTPVNRVPKIIKAIGDRLAKELPPGFKLPFS
jgi:hypothetical protein